MGILFTGYGGEQHLSQGELADLLDVSRQSVSKWETDASTPDLDKLVKLSGVFHVTLDELVQGVPPTLIRAAAPSGSTPILPPPGMPPRKIAGSILLGLWVLTVLLCTILGGLLEGLLLAGPFLGLRALRGRNAEKADP